MKAGTGWKRTIETCCGGGGIPEEPTRLTSGSLRIRQHEVPPPGRPSGTRAFSLPYVEEKEYSPYLLETRYFQCGWDRMGVGPRKQVFEVTVWLARRHSLWSSANLKGGNFHQAELGCRWRLTSGRRRGYGVNTDRRTRKPSGLCDIVDLFLYIHFKPYCLEVGFKEELRQ